MQENITLAPAAGAGIGKALADRLLARPGFIESMAEVAWNCLHAYSLRYDVLAKDTIKTPDFKVQSAMFFGLLAHMEGEPIKRIIHQHLGAEKGASLTVALRESPALLGAVKREVEKAEWADVHASRAQRAEMSRVAAEAEPSELPAE